MDGEREEKKPLFMRRSKSAIAGPGWHAAMPGLSVNRL
jgi:hypothetical protein